eukprot:767594-Hanusia_phi.AAC.21
MGARASAHSRQQVRVLRLPCNCSCSKQDRKCTRLLTLVVVGIFFHTSLPDSSYSTSSSTSRWRSGSCQLSQRGFLI